MAYSVTEGALCVMFSTRDRTIPVVAIAFHRDDNQWLVADARDPNRVYICFPRRLRRINCDRGEVSESEVSDLYSKEP